MGYRIISWLLGFLLVIAGILKLSGNQLDTLYQAGLFLPSWAYFGVIELEIAIGLWLLWGKNLVASWLVALGTFSFMACVSLYLGLMGHQTCGCFGSWHLKPWYAFSIDVSSLAALTFFRPRIPNIFKINRTNLTFPWKTIAGYSAGILSLFLILIAVSTYGFGSAEAALVFIRGEHVSFLPSVINAGIGKPGDLRNVSVEVVNWTQNTIKIVGGSSDCNCLMIKDLPFILSPGESRSIEMSMSFRGSPGGFSRKAWLMTDDTTQRFIWIGCNPSLP